MSECTPVLDELTELILTKQNLEILSQDSKLPIKQNLSRFCLDKSASEAVFNETCTPCFISKLVRLRSLVSQSPKGSQLLYLNRRRANRFLSIGEAYAEGDLSVSSSVLIPGCSQAAKPTYMFSIGEA